MNSRAYLLVIFTILWICDTVFTLIFVQRFGLETEANPIVRYVMATFGVYSLIPLKMSTWLPLYLIRRHVPRWLYCGLIAIMLPVVYIGARIALS